MLGLGNILSKGGVIQKFPNEYSFNFDGSNDYLELPAMSPTGTQSIAFWFKTSVLHGGPIYTNVDATSNFTSIAIYDGKLQVTLADTQNSSPARETTNTYNDNNWHHAVVVREDTSTCSAIYIDGALATTNTSLTWYGTNSQDEHSIGHAKQGTYNYYFNGLIDEVAVWSTDIGASVVAKIGSKPVDLTKYSASNLKLWLRAGDKVLPESTTSIARADFTAEFDGGSDEIRIKDYTGMSVGGSDHTITGWIKFNALNSDSGYTGIIYNGQSSSSNGHVGINPTNYLIGGTGGGSASTWNTVEADTDAGRFTTTGTWHHIAQIRQGNTLYLYKDGIMVKSGSHSVTPYALDEEPAIGSGGGAEYFNGAVSHVGIFTTALPANDIALMAKSRFTPTRDYMLKQVDFDGSNDYIDCGNDSSLQFSGSFSIGCWFKTTDASASNEHLFSKSNGGSDAGFGLMLDTSRKIKFIYHQSGENDGVFSTTDVTDSGSAINDGAWHHVMGVYTSGSKIELFKDGVSVGTSTSNVGVLPSHVPNLFIGGRDAGSKQIIACSVISAGVYSDAKDADFIKAQYDKGLFADWSADTNLNGYWRMGNGTGDTFPIIIDQSSNSNHGTMESMTSDDVVQNMVAGYDLGSYNTSSVATTVSYLNFVSSGTKDWVQLPMPFAPANAYTISIWLKPDGNNNYFFSARESSLGITMSLDANRKFWCTNKSDASQGALTGTNALALSVWSHVALTWDGTTLKAYINGDLDKSMSSAITMPTITTNARIGQSSQSDAYASWDGGISSVGLYNTIAKTQTEIQAIYVEGIAGDESTNSGIFAYYKLDTMSTSSGAIKDLVGTNHATISGDPSLGSIYNNGNYLISPVKDAKVAVIDVSNPVLSAELVGDPSFDVGGGDNITITNATDTEVTNGALEYTDGSTCEVTFEKSNANILTSGKFYKFVFTIADSLSTGARIKITFDENSGTANSYSDHQNYTDGTHTVYTISNTTGASINISGASPTFKMTDVSIKEIQGNVGKPTSMDATNFPYTSVLPDQSFLTGVNSAYSFIDLDGTDAHIPISVPALEDAFTVSAWVYFDVDASSSDFDYLISVGASGTRTHFSLGRFEDGAFYYFDGSSSKKSTSFTFSTTTWTHVLATVQPTSNRVKLYINGEEQDVAQPNGDFNISSSTGAIGRYQPSTTHYLNGRINNVSIINKTISSADTDAIYKLGRHGNLLDSYSDNLVNYYAFGGLDAVTGLADTDSTIYDRSGNGNHGTPSGTASGDLKSPPNAQPEGYDIESTTRTTTIP